MSYCFVLVLVRICYFPRRRGARTPPGLHPAREPGRWAARLSVLRDPLPDEATLNHPRGRLLVEPAVRGWDGGDCNSVPDGSVPCGSVPYGSLPYAHKPEVFVPYGSVPCGSVPGGSVPYGSIPEGFVTDGSVLDGFVADVSVASGSVSVRKSFVPCGVELDGSAESPYLCGPVQYDSVPEGFVADGSVLYGSVRYGCTGRFRDVLSSRFESGTGID